LFYPLLSFFFLSIHKNNDFDNFQAAIAGSMNCLNNGISGSDDIIDYYNSFSWMDMTFNLFRRAVPFCLFSDKKRFNRLIFKGTGIRGGYGDWDRTHSKPSDRINLQGFNLLKNNLTYKDHTLRVKHSGFAINVSKS